MRIRNKLAAAILSMSIITFAPSCSNEPNDSKETAEEMNEAKFDKDGQKEADKLVEACSSNLFEIKASENAELNAFTPEVRKLASMMVAAHTKMNEVVKGLARVKGINLPTELTSDQKEQMEKLAEKNSIDFDKTYTEKMKEKHENAIRFYERIAEKCEDGDIKLWAENTVSEVRGHLDMIMSAHNIIKDMK